MIIHDAAGGASTLGEDSAPRFPAELTRLPRWACWRSRTKKSRDRYKDGAKTNERVVFEALHPATGRELAASRPDEWVGYDLARRPTARKPFGGLAFLVRHADGLAVVRHADPEVVVGLGDSVLHAEQEVGGDGVLAIVRAGVFGTATDRFVPLSGRSPYQEPPATACPDGTDVLSGRNPCQDAAAVRTEPPCPDGTRAVSGRNDPAEPLSGRKPYQERASCPDGSRTVFSSSPLLFFSGDEDGDFVRTEVEHLARVLCEQGKGGDPRHWVYALIGVLRRHGLTPTTVPLPLLLTFATAIGADAGRVQRLVLARWAKWKAGRVPVAEALAIALAAVHTAPSLLTGLPPIADRATLLAAGMCHHLGKTGQPFPFPGRQLADVLGLGSQQEGSEVVGALVGLNLIRCVKEGRFASKTAAEYVWVAAGDNTPPPVVSSSPLPSPQAVSPSPRPGHSFEKTAEFCFKSQLGGYLTEEHFYAEKVTARRLAREDRELFGGFWSSPDEGKEYARQVVAARSLLKNYRTEAVGNVLRSKAGSSIYSLAASHVEPLVKAERERLDRRQAARSVEKVEPPPMNAPVVWGPLPPAPAKGSLLDKLSDL